MIALLSIAANLLWILGLSLVLVALSWANWAAKTSRTRLRSVLARPSIRRALDLGLVLFCAGLAATAHRGWEKAIWALAALIFTALSIWGTHDEKRSEENQNNEPGPPV